MRSLPLHPKFQPWILGTLLSREWLVGGWATRLAGGRPDDDEEEAVDGSQGQTSQESTAGFVTLALVWVSSAQAGPSDLEQKTFAFGSGVSTHSLLSSVPGSRRWSQSCSGQSRVHVGSGRRSCGTNEARTMSQNSAAPENVDGQGRWPLKEWCPILQSLSSATGLFGSSVDTQGIWLAWKTNTAEGWPDSGGWAVGCSSEIGASGKPGGIEVIHGAKPGMGTCNDEASCFGWSTVGWLVDGVIRGWPGITTADGWAGCCEPEVSIGFSVRAGWSVSKVGGSFPALLAAFLASTAQCCAPFPLLQRVRGHWKLAWLPTQKWKLWFVCSFWRGPVCLHMHLGWFSCHSSLSVGAIGTFITWHMASKLSLHPCKMQLRKWNHSENRQESRLFWTLPFIMHPICTLLRVAFQPACCPLFKEPVEPYDLTNAAAIQSQGEALEGTEHEATHGSPWAMSCAPCP